MFKIILVAVVVTIAGLFVMTKIDPANQNNNISITTKYTGEDAVKVSISGQILHPGTYDCNPNSTLGTIIDMAGCFLENADPTSYTESLIIGSRTEFYIPKKAEIPETCLVENIEKVNINTASASELKEAGFTSSQAQAIVDYRDEHGNFQAIEDILDVSGIGEKTYLAMRDKICLS